VLPRLADEVRLHFCSAGVLCGIAKGPRWVVGQPEGRGWRHSWLKGSRQGGFQGVASGSPESSWPWYGVWEELMRVGGEAVAERWAGFAKRVKG
jgi:hypothetical protein